MSREPTEEEVDERAEWILRQLVGQLRTPFDVTSMLPAARSQARAQLREEARHPGNLAGGPERTRPAPARGPGRPGWTKDVFWARYREAEAATGLPRTEATLAANFQALDGSIGVDADHLRRLRRKFRRTGVGPEG
jgi:hypothetical protein